MRSLKSLSGRRTVDICSKFHSMEWLSIYFTTGGTRGKVRESPRVFVVVVNVSVKSHSC